jgi:hypothetical protein
MDGPLQTARCDFVACYKQCPQHEMTLCSLVASTVALSQCTGPSVLVLPLQSRCIYSREACICLIDVIPLLLCIEHVVAVYWTAG